jgi:lipopolysaccharide transport system permease protein
MMMSSLGAPFVCAWRQRELIARMTKRDIAARYQGSWFGVLWNILNPLILLLVYTFVFGVVLNARWSGATWQSGSFALPLFSGLIVFNLFAECATRAPTIILNNVNLVKKVVFPLEIFPLVILGTASFNLLINVTLLAIFMLVGTGSLPGTFALIVLVLVPYIMLMAGVTWIIAAMGVFFRDLAQVVALLVTGLLFLSPIFYPPSAIPKKFDLLVHANPIAWYVSQARNVMVFDLLPDWAGLGGALLLGFVVAWVGFMWFKRNQTSFADVV